MHGVENGEQMSNGFGQTTVDVVLSDVTVQAGTGRSGATMSATAHRGREARSGT